MNKLIIPAIALVALAASVSPASAPSAVTIIPGTHLVASSAVPWRSGEFYGLKHCEHDDYNDSMVGGHDPGLCFSVDTSTDRVIVLFPDTATAQGREVVTSVRY